MTMATLSQEFERYVRKIFPAQDYIPLHAPQFRGNERQYVLDTLESTFVSSVGNYVDKFELAIAEFTGSQYVIATNTGTSALHIALMLCGVGKEDEVVTQSLTFVGTSNAIRYCGAHPVFVDVERETLGLSPKKLAEFLEENTEVRDDGLCWNRVSNRIIKVCVPVHNLGHPVRCQDIQEICAQYHISVVEDAAESLGSVSNGVHTGRIGRTGILSFNGNKIVTTGGGGAIMTDDKDIARKAKHLTTTAKKSHPWLFLHDKVGYNYRLPNLNAALGCGQMEQLPTYVESKRKLASLYQHWFNQREVEFIMEPRAAISNYWLNAILLENRSERDCFLQYMNDRGIMTRPMWTPLHTLPMYKNCLRGPLQMTEHIEDRLVNIPSSVIG